MAFCALVIIFPFLSTLRLKISNTVDAEKNGMIPQGKNCPWQLAKTPKRSETKMTAMMIRIDKNHHYISPVDKI
jgi:hypothetical protein